MTQTLQTSAARTVWPRSAARACSHSVRRTLSLFCVKFVVFVGAHAAGLAAGGDVVNPNDVTPPLPNADFSVVIPKSSWPHEAFTRQTLLPNQRMMIILEDISSVRVWPRNILTEAYDVDDGLCDLGSLKSYMYLFGKAPISYNFWEVIYHQVPGSGQTVKALVFISPPREYHTGRKQEFCFQFRERKGTGSMFVIIRTSEATHGRAVSLVLTVTSLLFFAAFPYL